MAGRDIRRDALYLRDITEAVDAIAGFLAGISEQQFLASNLLQSAILQKLPVIGEAAARISPERKTTAPEVSWAAVVGLRNVAVHVYFSIQWRIIWETATTDVPTLCHLVQSLREVEVPPAP